MSKPLHNPRWEAYCLAYVGPAERDAGRAAELVKYAPAYGAQLMLKEQIQNRIVELMIEAAARQGVTPERVIDEAAALAFSDITEVLTLDEHGDLVLRGALQDLPREVRVAIKSIEVRETRRTIAGRGEDDPPDELVTRNFKLTLHDKIEPLKLLAIYTSAVVGGRPGDAANDLGDWTGIDVIEPPKEATDG